MKRRSARPFVVEIKHTHPSRSSQNQPAGAARPGKPLWPALPPEEPERPASEAWYASDARHTPDVQPVPSQPEAPARRVLPSLLPMFVPSEPEPRDEAAAEAPAARRAAAKPRPRKAAVPAPAPLLDDTVESEAPESEAPSWQASPSLPTTQPALKRTASAKPSLARRKQDELGPGQRWKKRLNRFCR